MGATVFSAAEWADAAAAPVAVPAPIGEPVSQVRVRAETSASAPRTRFGVWKCSPGTWRRQIVQAEFCHFLSGEAEFVPDDGGAAVTLRAGDTAYFPENSAGVWTVRAASRKVFVTFDETIGATR